MKYKFYQKAHINGKTVHGLIKTVNSKKKALQLINEYNALLTDNHNLKQVLDFTHPLKEHLDNFKKWNTKTQYKKEVAKLNRHNGIDVENMVYTNKHYTVIKTK